jgi:histidine ammonia-lyase
MGARPERLGHGSAGPPWLGTGVDAAQPVTVVLDGVGLSLDQVMAVARRGGRVALAPAALDRMRRCRRVLEQAGADGAPIYGFSTGAGALKRVALDSRDVHRFNRLMVMNCRVGQGPPASDEVVRGTLLRLANNLARGTTGVRPELAELVVRALNEHWPITVRTLGSVGQADLAQTGDVAAALIDKSGFELEAGEGMAMLDNNSYSTAVAALAVADCMRLADALDVAGALDMEAFVANPSILHGVLRERPYKGLQTTAARLRELLADSSLWQPGAPRNLQDPLTFRCLPQLHGALRDALAYARGQLEIELNAAQNNPLVDLDQEQVVAVGCFEVLPLAAALDFLRIALAPVLTSANERTMKLLHGGFSGLAPGLAARPDRGDDGFTEFGVAGQALAAEARLLAAPVSFEMVSSTQAEGIEDRMTMAPLAGRRLAEMVDLGQRLVAIELVVAARAVDLRGGAQLGMGTGAAHRLVRRCIPATVEGEPVPADLEPLVELVRSGAVGEV